MFYLFFFLYIFVVVVVVVVVRILPERWMSRAFARTSRGDSSLLTVASVRKTKSVQKCCESALVTRIKIVVDNLFEI